MNEIIKIGAVVSGLGGILVYFIKKIIDYKVSSKVGKLLAVNKKYHELKFDVVIKLNGHLSQINHCIEHINSKNLNYQGDCEKWCKKIREESRENISVIRKPYYKMIKTATDSALSYSKNPNEADYKNWMKNYSNLEKVGNEKLKEYKIEMN